MFTALLLLVQKIIYVLPIFDKKSHLSCRNSQILSITKGSVTHFKCQLKQSHKMRNRPRMSIFMYYCPTKFGKYHSSCPMNFYVEIGIHLHSVKRIRKIFQPHPHCFEVVRVIFYLFNGVQFNFSLSVYNFELFLFQAANVQQQLTDIKAANQSAQYLGNRVEMAITTAIEKNKTLLKVGLHFEYGDCRSVHLLWSSKYIYIPMTS